MTPENPIIEGTIFLFGLPHKENLFFKSFLEDAGLEVQLISSNGQKAEWFKDLSPDLLLFDPAFEISTHKHWKEELQKIAISVGIPFLTLPQIKSPQKKSGDRRKDQLDELSKIIIQIRKHKEQKRILALQDRLPINDDLQTTSDNRQVDSASYFDQFFLNSSISTIVFDPQGWAIRVNQRFSEIFGIEACDIENGKYNIFKDKALEANGYVDGIKNVFELQHKGEWDIVYDIGLSAESQQLKVRNKLKKVFRTWAFPITNRLGRLTSVVIQHLDLSEIRKKDSDLLLHAQILDNLAEGVSLTRSSDGVIVFTNPIFDRIFGYNVGELLGKHVSCLNASGEKTAEEVASSIIASLHEKGVWNGELLNVRKDGSTFWTMANVTTFDHPEFGPVWISAQQEITDRIEAEMALRKAEFENRTILNTFPYLLFRMDRAGVIFDFRAPDASLLLMEPHLFLGKNYKDVLPANLLPKLSRNFATAFNTMRVVNIDYSMIIHGQELFFEGRVIPISEQEILLFVHDVTEAKKIRDAIHVSEERYNLIIEATQDGIWDWDIVNDQVYVSARWCEIMGVQEKEGVFKEVLPNWLQRIHPKHRSMAETTLKNQQTHPGTFEIEYLYEIGNDNYFWRRTIGQAIFSSEGKVVRMLGSVVDIDEKKKFELKLEKSIQEASDYKDALDQSAIISLSDTAGTILYVNNKFCEQYGYTQNEVLGQNHSLLNSGIHPTSFWEHFWETITAGKVLKAEVCNKGKNGDLHWSDTTIFPFLNTEGVPYQYLVIRNDITEKRTLEKELSEQQLMQQKLITEVALQEQEKEKNELGRELHDNINQILATAKIYLGMARSKDGDVDALLENSFTHLTSAIEEIRRLSHELVAPSLGDIGLNTAIQTLLGESNFPDTFKVVFQDDVEDFSMIGKEGELMLYRIIQEQLNNIRKHSKAKSVVIKFSSRKKGIELSIIDDGVGFDKSKHLAGIGLKNIQNRVDFYSGTMLLDTAPGMGCALHIRIPFVTSLAK